MLNSTDAPLKRSSVDKQTNYYVSSIFAQYLSFLFFLRLIPLRLPILLHLRQTVASKKEG